MSIRKTTLVDGEYYHIYNRGVEKRSIVEDNFDVARFMQSLVDFNTLEPIGSIYEKNKHAEKSHPDGSRGSTETQDSQLVEIVAYCLNPNHFHFLLKQVADNGIEQFMQRLGGGYTKYFNHKYKRSGHLFQGPFKSIHVGNDEYLLHLSAYINLNYRVHGLDADALKLCKSSFTEYADKSVLGLCEKTIVLNRFANPTEYIEYANDAVLSTIEGRIGAEMHELCSE